MDTLIDMHRQAVLAHPSSQPFWEAARQGRLMLPRCLACGRCHWYPRAFCPLDQRERKILNLAEARHLAVRRQNAVDQCRPATRQAEDENRALNRCRGEFGVPSMIVVHRHARGKAIDIAVTHAD